MKFINYLFLISSLNSLSQSIKIANISYNLNNEIINERNRKIIEKNGEITFYIKGNYFRYNENSKKINIPKSEIEKLTLKTIPDIISYRNKLIEKDIKDSEKNEKLKILENSEVYEEIYIYERKRDSILKYPVTWLEVIECQ
jgi:hypothetical protein